MVIGGLSSNPCDWLVLKLVFIGENGIVPILPIRLLLNSRLRFPFDYLEIVSVLQKREEKRFISTIQCIMSVQIIELCRFLQVMTRWGNTAGVMTLSFEQEAKRQTSGCHSDVWGTTSWFLITWHCFLFFFAYLLQRLWGHQKEGLHFLGHWA